jgi:hypothetical protein
MHGHAANGTNIADTSNRMPNQIVRYEPLPEYATVIGNYAWLLFPFTPSSLDVFEATTLDEAR